MLFFWPRNLFHLLGQTAGGSRNLRGWARATDCPHQKDLLSTNTGKPNWGFFQMSSYCYFEKTVKSRNKTCGPHGTQRVRVLSKKYKLMVWGHRELSVGI